MDGVRVDHISIACAECLDRPGVLSIDVDRKDIVVSHIVELRTDLIEKTRVVGTLHLLTGSPSRSRPDTHAVPRRVVEPVVGDGVVPAVLYVDTCAVADELTHVVDVAV